MDWQTYANLSGNSGVTHYLIEGTAIKIRFRSDPVSYVYTERRPGVEHVNRMKALAAAGRGLAAYINRRVRGNFDHRELPPQR